MRPSQEQTTKNVLVSRPLERVLKKQSLMDSLIASQKANNKKKQKKKGETGEVFNQTEEETAKIGILIKTIFTNISFAF